MPSVLIEVRRQYTAEQEVALIEAVHAALREGFKTCQEIRKSTALFMSPTALRAHPREKNLGLSMS